MCPGAEPDTIVMIHGLWLTARSWERWKERYEARGYTVLAPSWPGMEAEVEVLNADPRPIARLTIDVIVDHYEKLIRDLPVPPIVFGHSFGGIFMQVLLDRGVGAAGVGVASAAVKGVLDVPLSQIRSVSSALSPFKKGEAVGLSPKEFHYAFTNTLSEVDSHAIYERYHVPAPTDVLQEGALASLHRHAPTKVDFARAGRAPLLMVGFGEDHLVPPKVVRSNERKYDDDVSVTEYVVYPGRPHFPGAPGWEVVADASLDWAEHTAIDFLSEGRSDD
jgi:pimeloyl-ACP methyl ester carboxylesterase